MYIPMLRGDQEDLVSAHPIQAAVVTQSFELVGYQRKAVMNKLSDKIMLWAHPGKPITALLRNAGIHCSSAAVSCC